MYIYVYVYVYVYVCVHVQKGTILVKQVYYVYIYICIVCVYVQKGTILVKMKALKCWTLAASTMHAVKCGRFHSATEVLVTAYSKEFSNESCREA